MKISDEALTKVKHFCSAIPKRKRRLQNLIFGGEEAEMDEFPFIGALGYRSHFNKLVLLWQCSSSLISYQFMLTAAHCNRDQRPEVVRLGSVNIYDESFSNKWIDVEIENIIPYPQYDRQLKYHDIALIKLKKMIEMSENIYQICLFAGMELPEDLKMTTEGWGITDEMCKYEFIDFPPI